MDTDAGLRKLNMNPLWRQANPVDQLVTIRGAIEGWLSTLTEQKRLAELEVKIQPLLDQIMELEPYLRGENKWIINR